MIVSILTIYQFFHRLFHLKYFWRIKIKIFLFDFSYLLRFYPSRVLSPYIFQGTRYLFVEVKLVDDFRQIKITLCH